MCTRVLKIWRCNMETKCGRFDKVIQYWPDSRHDFDNFTRWCICRTYKDWRTNIFVSMVTKLKKYLCCLYSGIYLTVLGSDFVDLLTLPWRFPCDFVIDILWFWRHLATLDKGVSNISYHYKSFNSVVRDFMQVCICIVITHFSHYSTYFRFVFVYIYFSIIFPKYFFVIISIWIDLVISIISINWPH